MNKFCKKSTYRIIGSYDTETTNIGSGVETRAFPVLFIYNDFQNIGISEYEYGAGCIRFFRHTNDFLDYLKSNIIEQDLGYIPIVCAYNLMFDLQPLMYDLAQNYDLEVCAQTATNIYYMDVKKEGVTRLRFWDTYHLERNGLAAMGEVAGVKKLKGDWDYSLIRTPETPITDEEQMYAKHDVEIIPLYLRYILESNPKIKSEDLGVKIVTNTSLVRFMAKTDIGALEYKNSNGNKIKLSYAWEKTCFQNRAMTYESYATRKACFRGGLTFTAGCHASQTQTNVLSLDVTSMHHAFINGVYQPVHFHKAQPDLLTKIVNDIITTPIDFILKNYYRPFNAAIHACIRFSNIRLKNESVFEKSGIACIPESKFGGKLSFSDGIDERAFAAESGVQSQGFVDKAEQPVFAFSKLISAKRCDLFLNEIELWTIAQVYDFDDIEPLFGETTIKWVVPPDYVSLQSNVLYEMKNAAKKINKAYHEGERYKDEISPLIPEVLSEKIRTGVLSNAFLEAYYSRTVKSMFNSIYGTQAQDIFKPDYVVDGTGELSVNPATVISPETWEELQPKKYKVMYTYGMRIVGGSRMHLCIAIMLLDAYFHDRIKILGGDTDSIKMSASKDVTSEEIMKALRPLHSAIDGAINFTQKRIRKLYPDLAASFENLGNFEIENEPYPFHLEAWNKARISEDDEGNIHITCAGLSRPVGLYTYENFVHDLRREHTFEEVAPLALGYNVEVSPDLSHSLQKHRPLTTDRYTGDVTDYRGVTSFVDEPQSIALYPAPREIGDTTKRSNHENVMFLTKCGKNVDISLKYAVKDENEVYITGFEDGKFKRLL